MSHFATNRAALSARRADLLRRLTRIEDDLDRFGIGTVPGGATDDSVASTILSDVIGNLEREIGLIESAMRRIDTREYDCCLQCGGTIDHARLERLPYAVNCASCSARYRLDSVDLLRGHHSSLRRLIFNVIHALHDTAERPDDSVPAPAADVGRCIALLADLARVLPQRFAQEERAGQIREALHVAPRFSARAARLFGQHGEFVQRADVMVREAEVSTPVDLSTLRDRFREFALDLLAHEQSEADIVESAFLDDLGGID